MARVMIFDASPGCDYWPCGHYEAPFVPMVGDRVHLTDSPRTEFRVAERQMWVNQTTGEVSAIIHITEVKPKKRWWQR